MYVYYCVQILKFNKIFIQNLLKMNTPHIYILLMLMVTIYLFLTENPSKNSQLKHIFEHWSKIHNKIYKNQMERYYRFTIFSQNYQMVGNHNKRYDDGLTRYRMQLSFYSDLLESQYYFADLLRNSQNQQNLLKVTMNCSGSILDTPNPPEIIDWIGRQTVHQQLPVEYAGCPSSWAFVTAAAIQGLYKIKKGSLETLSVAQLIQCSGFYGNQGCHGGFMEQAYWYIIDKGIALSSTYKFNQSIIETQPCHYLTAQKFVGISRCASVPSQNYYKLLSAVVQQPVTAAISFPEKMAHYQSGIFDQEECTPDIHLDRGILIAGYGEDDGGKYWEIMYSRKVSNETGRLKLLRTEENGPGTCGIQLAASVPQNII